MKKDGRRKYSPKTYLLIYTCVEINDQTGKVLWQVALLVFYGSKVIHKLPMIMKCKIPIVQTSLDAILDPVTTSDKSTVPNLTTNGTLMKIWLIY